MKSVHLLTCTFIPTKRIAIPDVLFLASLVLWFLSALLCFSPFLLYLMQLWSRAWGLEIVHLGLVPLLANGAVLTRVPNPFETVCSCTKRDGIHLKFFLGSIKR